MTFDHISTAFKNDGVLSVLEYEHGIKAIMHWLGEDAVSGGYCATLLDALASLDASLAEDAATFQHPSANVSPVTS
jgi:hypothetical protein